MSDNVEVVRELFRRVDAANVDPNDKNITRFFEVLTDDIHYQNRPQRPVDGKAEFREFFREFAECTQMSCTILRASADGEVVLTQRLDSWTIRGIRCETPVMGAFTIRDGKIASWVDYVPDIEKWKQSGQFEPSFWARWHDDTPISHTVAPVS